MFTSCSDDDLDNKSIIVGNTTTETPFDKWLTSNYVEPYNIQFLWRYNHNETNMQYYKDKYYSEDGKLYLCTRDSGIPLAYLPSQLVGQYFEVVAV